MTFVKIRFYLILFLYLCTMLRVYGQKTSIRGIVTDISGEALPYVNVVFKHSTVGTITDPNGLFFVETTQPTDTIIASSLGFKLEKRAVIKGVEQEINFTLVPSSIDLEAVEVRPGENPAFAYLEKINARKKFNNPDRFQSYQYKSYNKLRLDINNIDDGFKKQRLMKDFQFIFEYMDSSEMFGKNYLPILFTESVTQYYHQKTPPVDKEVIEAFKLSGIDNASISQFSGKMYQRLNVYDNFMQLFEPGFVSPIADFGRAYYKYYLEDSASLNGSWCYKISFKPKRKKERTFYGYFWVADTSWAIKKIQLRVSADVNINFMNDLVAINEYSKINDSIWFLSKEELLVDFYLADKLYGFFGRKEANYEDIKLNLPIPKEIRKNPTNTILIEDSLKREETYWTAKRGPQGLTQQEQDVYHMVDSVKQVPKFNTMYKMGEMFIDSYYVLGPIELGPYYTLYSVNPIEGNRFRVGGRTSYNLSTNYRIGGHVAYGTKDERWKYGLEAEYLASKIPRHSVGFSNYHDMRQLGKSQNALSDDNFMMSILRRQPNYKLTMVNQTNLYYNHEWFQGFSNSIKLTHQVIFPTEYIPFVTIENDEEFTQSSLISSEITLSTHFAYREKFLLGRYDRVSLGAEFPILDVDFTFGPKGIIGSQYEYFKFKIRIRDKIETNPIGYFKYWLTVGKIYGDIPYPLLELHQGNETYAYDVYAFNMMNYYEFVSDKYASLFAEHHFQGFFLNNIPLIKKLGFREVISTRMLVGNLRESNQDGMVMLFPEGLMALSKPYFEASAGIENILNIFRIDATWRLSYKDNPNIQIFGIRASMLVTF